VGSYELGIVAFRQVRAARGAAQRWHSWHQKWVLKPHLPKQKSHYVSPKRVNQVLLAQIQGPSTPHGT
jgi:hypothetical protein